MKGEVDTYGIAGEILSSGEYSDYRELSLFINTLIFYRKGSLRTEDCRHKGMQDGYVAYIQSGRSCKSSEWHMGDKGTWPNVGRTT